MRHGFSFQEALPFLGAPQFMDMVTSLLETGKKADSFLYSYLPKDTQNYFACFLKFMPMRNALEASLAIADEKKQEKETLFRSLLYPVLLLVGVNAGIILFNEMIVPSLKGLAESAGSVNSGSFLIVTVMAFIARLFLTLVCFFLLAWIFFTQEKKKAEIYHRIAVKNPKGMIVQIGSEKFVRFFVSCLKENMSSQETFAILKSLDHEPVVSLIARQMDENLNRGEAFMHALQEADIEPGLLSFFRIGSEAGDPRSQLEGYLEMSRERTKRRIAFFAKAVSLFSYLTAGMILIIVYRILMMPLNMLM